MYPTLIKNFVSPDLRQALHALALLSDDKPDYYQKAGKKTRVCSVTRGDTWDVPGPLWGEAVLLSHKRAAEEASGLKLTPSYSFGRFYRDESFLVPHIDRPACEVSFTVCLASDIKEPATFWVSHNEKVYEFDLEPGDAVLYSGLDVHGRRTVHGWYLGLMLHYVNSDGDNTDFAYDGRPGTGKLYEGIRQDLGGDA